MGQPQSLIHCTGAYTDSFRPGFDSTTPAGEGPGRWGWPRSFTLGLASDAPDVRAGLRQPMVRPVWPRLLWLLRALDAKLHIVRAIPNLRKISMSPWVNVDRGAERIGRDFNLLAEAQSCFAGGRRTRGRRSG